MTGAPPTLPPRSMAPGACWYMAGCSSSPPSVPAWPWGPSPSTRAPTCPWGAPAAAAAAAAGKRWGPPALPAGPHTAGSPKPPAAALPIAAATAAAPLRDALKRCAALRWEAPVPQHSSAGGRPGGSWRISPLWCAKKHTGRVQHWQGWVWAKLLCQWRGCMGRAPGSNSRASPFAACKNQNTAISIKIFSRVGRRCARRRTCPCWQISVLKRSGCSLQQGVGGAVARARQARQHARAKSWGRPVRQGRRIPVRACRHPGCRSPQYAPVLVQVVGIQALVTVRAGDALRRGWERHRPPSTRGHGGSVRLGLARDQRASHPLASLHPLRSHPLCVGARNAAIGDRPRVAPGSPFTRMGAGAAAPVVGKGLVAGRDLQDRVGGGAAAAVQSPCRRAPRSAAGAAVRRGPCDAPTVLLF
jgi:hypothetical protein